MGDRLDLVRLAAGPDRRVPRFEITPAFQERFGYPALTPEVKRRILGHNAIDLFGITPPAGVCRRPAEGFARTNRTLGPVSRRDVLATFLREHPWMRTPEP